jgi:molybdopterin-guanine dinucleotide biosynthesis protein A
MKRHTDISAFILAGGTSTRMGRAKGLLDFGGEPLIARTASLLEPIVRDVTVIGTPANLPGLGLRSIADRKFRSEEAEGTLRTPLAGIATALSVTAAPWNLVLACDLPYLTQEWLGWLLGRAANSNAQIVMPRTSRGLEPLASVYRLGCAAPILAALERGVRKVTDAISDLRTEYEEEDEWREHDPDHCVLRNMNTPEDYEEARKWWERKNPRT